MLGSKSGPSPAAVRSNPRSDCPAVPCCASVSHELFVELAEFHAKIVLVNEIAAQARVAAVFVEQRRFFRRG